MILLNSLELRMGKEFITKEGKKKDNKGNINDRVDKTNIHEQFETKILM